MVSVQTQRPRNYALDFIKVVATTIIVFHHYQYLDMVQFPHYLNFSANPYFPFYMMVELFFCISGFFAYRLGGVSTSAVGGERFRRYIGKKMIRLLPVLACSNVVAWILNFLYYRRFYTTVGGVEIPNFWGLIVSCLGLQEGLGFGGYRVNISAWFVAALLLAYTVYYLFSFAAQRKKWSLEWMIVILLFASTGFSTSGVNFPFFSAGCARAYISFSIGLLTAAFLARYQLTAAVRWAALGSFAAPLLFIAFASAYVDAANVFVFMMCPALLILAQTPAAGKCFRHAIWQRLSEISFNVFVWHYPLQCLMYHIAYDYMHAVDPTHMYAFTLLAWVVGAISHFALELPLRRWLPKVLKRAFVEKKTACEK